MYVCSKFVYVELDVYGTIVSADGARKHINVTEEGAALENAGWEERLDLETGEHYYRNRTTGEKTWQKPAELGGNWDLQYDSATGTFHWYALIWQLSCCTCLHM